MCKFHTPFPNIIGFFYVLTYVNVSKCSKNLKSPNIMSMAMLHYVIHIYKSGHQKDMCFEKIRLSAQNLLIFLGSVVDINKGRGHACSFQHRHPPIDPHNSKVTKPQPTFILNPHTTTNYTSYLYGHDHFG